MPAVTATATATSGARHTLSGRPPPRGRERRAGTGTGMGGAVAMAPAGVQGPTLLGTAEPWSQESSPVWAIVGVVRPDGNGSSQARAPAVRAGLPRPFFP